MKSRDGESQRREEKRRRKKITKGARKGRKVTKHCVFPMISGSAGSKSRLAKAKATGAEPSGQMRDEKLHAVVARSKFRSQNVQSTSASEHFLPSEPRTLEFVGPNMKTWFWRRFTKKAG